jgi:hypothetical protein
MLFGTGTAGGLLPTLGPTDLTFFIFDGLASEQEFQMLILIRQKYFKYQ